MNPCEFIISATLEKIHHLRRQDDVFSDRVDQQLKLIQRELQSMRTFLELEERKLRQHDEQAKAWMADMIAVACDVENAVDMVELVAKRSPRIGPNGAKSDDILVPFRNIGAKIEEIKKIARMMNEMAENQLPSKWPSLMVVEKDSAAYLPGKRMEESKEKTGKSSSTGWLIDGSCFPEICEGDQGPSSLIKRLGEYGNSAALSQGENVIDSLKDADLLVQRLTSGDKLCGVVSIVAPGGAGKTTLAHTIYKRDDVKKYFGAAAACITLYRCDELKDYVTKEVLPDIAEQVMDMPKQDAAQMNAADLQQKLSEFLKEKRFLIVLDNVWNQHAWDLLKEAFPDGKNGSRIMLTTRNMGVARHASPNPANPPYELPLLTPEGSWKLFLKKAFPWTAGEITCPAQLEGIGKEIVAECMGLPLAIKVIGGLIAAREEGNVKDWKLVLASLKEQQSQESEHLKVLGYDSPNSVYDSACKAPDDFPDLLPPPRRRLRYPGFSAGYNFRPHRSSPYLASDKLPVSADFDSLGSLEEEQTQESEHCSKVLALGYYDLPYYLKPCFVYLGLFPPGGKINVEKLMLLWVAEGFIQPREEQSKEDIAKEYFLELTGRSMIEIAERGWNGDAVTCCIDDSLYELALSEAEQHRFFKIKNHQVSSFTPYNTRRLAIHSRTTGSQISYSSQSFRSLLGFTPSMKRLTDESFLRVLDLEGVKIGETMLDLVTKGHVHLKYLNLSGTSVKSLPPSIGNLYSLEVLLLDYNTRLPKEIWNLNRLRHLYALDCEFEGLPQLEHLKNLDTLCLSAGDWIEHNRLSSLSSLRILKLAGDIGSHFECLWFSIGKPIRLQSLVLSDSSIATEDQILPDLTPLLHLYEMVLAVNLERLPEPHKFPPNLTKLVLVGSELEEDPMPILEKLANLQILQLSGDAYQGKKMMSSAGGFPKLICLAFLCMNELEEWIVEEGAMPKLVNLSISVCRNLIMLPEGLRFITTLKEFETWDISKELHDRLQESKGEDWYKIQNVPYLRICK